MPSNANYFWLSSMRSSTDVTALSPALTPSSAAAGDQLGSYVIAADRAVLGAIITITTALTTPLRIRAKISIGGGNFVNSGVICLAPGNTIADCLFGDILRANNKTVIIEAVDAFTGAVGLHIAVYSALWSYWNPVLGPTPTPTPSPSPTPTPTPTPTHTPTPTPTHTPTPTPTPTP